MIDNYDKMVITSDSMHWGDHYINILTTHAGNEDELIEAIQSLQVLHDGRAVDIILNYVNDANLSIRVAAISALGILRVQRSIPMLRNIIRDGSKPEEINAVEQALENIQKEIVFPIMFAPLQEKFRKEAGNTYKILQKRGDDYIITKYKDDLYSNITQERKKALLVIDHIERDDVIKLIEYVAINDEIESLQISAILALARRGVQYPIEQLKKALIDLPPWSAEEAIEAIVFLQVKSCIPNVIDALMHPRVEVRILALSALYKLTDCDFGWDLKSWHDWMAKQ